MKETTRKILLALYPAAQQLQIQPDQGLMLARAVLRNLVPEISEAGFNSLIFLLEKKAYLQRHQVADSTQYSLSSYGITELEAQFPALLSARQQWRGEWTVIVFLTAPKSDQNFRYLRQFLLSHSCFNLSRAVFLYPGSPSELIMHELTATYRQGVVMLKVSDWLFGDERIIMGQKIGLKDSVEIYSGLSKELDRLTAFGDSQKAFKDQQKSDFHSIFDRLVAALASDSGLIGHYYPRVEGSLSLLARWQKMLSI